MVLPAVVAALKAWAVRWIAKKGVLWVAATLVAVFGDDVARAVAGLFDPPMRQRLEDGINQARRPTAPPVNIPDLVDDQDDDDDTEPPPTNRSVDALDDAWTEVCAIADDRDACSPPEPDVVIRHQV